MRTILCAVLFVAAMSATTSDNIINLTKRVTELKDVSVAKTITTSYLKSGGDGII